MDFSRQEWSDEEMEDFLLLVRMHQTEGNIPDDDDVYTDPTLESNQIIVS
jgi:uncharacterized protein YdaU (DUF1376 family)